MKNLILLLFFLFMVCFMPIGQGQANAADLDYGEEVEIKPLPNPKREVSVIVSPEGFYPQNLTVFKGEEVTFFVTGTKESPDCLILSNHALYLGAVKGKVTTSAIKFDQVGEFSMYCPGNINKGKVIVMNKKGARKPASAPKEWMPREK